MRLEARVEIDCEDPALAAAVREALAPEDEPFVLTRVEGATVVAEASAGSPEGLLRTLDDYLACLATAERTARAGREG